MLVVLNAMKTIKKELLKEIKKLTGIFLYDIPFARKQLR